MDRNFMSDFLPIRHAPSPDHLPEAEKRRFDGIVEEIRGIQLTLHRQVRRLAKIERRSPKVSNLLKKIWIIEWSLSKIGILRMPICLMEGLSPAIIQEIRKQLWEKSHGNRPMIQIVGGPNLGSIRLFTLKGFCEPQLTIKLIPEMLVMMEEMLAEMGRLINSAVRKRERIVVETQGSNPELMKLANSPIEEYYQAKESVLKFVQIHKFVSHIRVTARCFQLPEERQKLVAVEMTPAWGRAATIWRAGGWKANCDITKKLVVNEPCQVTPFPSNPLMSVLEWNVRGAGNSEFISAANNLLDETKPVIAIFTETRIQKSEADEITEDLHLDSWETTDTIGFKGGIWVGWNSNLATVEILSATSQELHALVRLSNQSHKFIVPAIYVSPRFVERKLIRN